MSRSWWPGPGYRRDALIVVGLVVLGLLFNLLIGVLMVILFEMLDVWGWWSEARAVYAGADT